MQNDASDLLSFVASMGAEGSLRVEENLGSGYVRLLVAEAERRQAAHDIQHVEDVVIELLRNSRDAGATHIFVATSREGTTRTICVLDDGSGIPQSMHEKIFEARVTSKLESVHMDRWGVHGRGMALYSIRENASEALVLASSPGLGTSIRVITDAEVLSERADQSTWPEVAYDEQGALICVRGPKNIIRTCCDFALTERGVCEVFYGSMAEIVATSRAVLRPHVSAAELIRMDSLAKLPFLERLVAALDAQELAAEASSLGLTISERTALRICSGQIEPVKNVLDQIYPRQKNADKTAHEVDLVRDHRSLSLSEEDKRAFAALMDRDFSYLADRYYLKLASNPHIRVDRNRIQVTFDLRDKD